MIKNKKNFFLIFFSLIFFSILLFRGRLGSDDLEVFNFVYNFDLYNGNFFEYLNHLNSNGEKIYYNDAQKHHFYTFHHRLGWVFQTFFAFYFVDLFLNLLNLKSVFLKQYFSGYLLSFYSVLSVYFCYRYLVIKERMQMHSAIFLVLIIFFSTSLLYIFSGQYIESLAVLILSIRLNTKNSTILFLLDIFLLFIKPFYFLIVFILRITEIKKNIITFSKFNISIYLNIFLILFSYSFLRLSFVDLDENLKYFQSQDPKFAIELYLINLFNFYFSFGTGLIFIYFIPIYLIFLGKKKSTIYKLATIFLLSLILSFFEGFHGSVAGVRHLLPFVIIFFPEYKLGFDKLILKKKIIILFIFITIINLPTLEYRNFNIGEYANGSVYKNKTEGVAKMNRSGDWVMYEWPITSYKFHPIYFSNNILIKKILKKKEIKINQIKFKLKNIYPQTGLGRIIFIGKNNIPIDNQFVKSISLKFFKIFQFIYIITILALIMFIFYLYKKIIV